MTRLKRSTLLLTALLSAGTINLAAAAPGNDPQDGEYGKHHFAEKFAEHRAERVGALFASWDLSEDKRDAYAQAQQDYREQRKTLREQHQQQLAEIFDKEQLKALHAMQRPSHPGPGKPMDHDHRGPGKRGAQHAKLIDALFTSWELNEDQRTQLDEAREHFMSEAKALRKQEFENREARHDVFQALREEHRQALSQVLNESQMAVLDQMIPKPHRAPDQK